MKNFLKNNIFGIIIGVVIGISSVVIADTINSNEVLYDNSDSVSNDTTVKGALDSLFDIVDHSSTGFSLLARNTSGLSNELLGGLYRYQGTNVNNYICFGTTNTNTCINNTDKHMYRIIGIDSAGKMKLIKKEALNTAYKWNSSNGVTWPNSDLYNGLNGSYFLTNTDYVPNNWADKIVMSGWHYGVVNAYNNASDMAGIELSLPNTVNAKIGLMYLHDYYYGLQGDNNCYGFGSGLCNQSWIHFTKNDSNPPNPDWEWTISLCNDYFPWTIWSNGYVQGNNYNNMIQTLTTRPVFFLKSNERIVSGSGTLSDPYILEDLS